MARPLPDTTQEEVFFAERTTLKRAPRAAKRVKVVTVSNKGAILKKGGRGNPYRNTRSGTRSDLDLNVRSNWEANVLRVLNLFRIGFKFEPTVFPFPASPKTGQIQSYLPDIYLPKTDEYIEVKGYLDSGGRSKLRRFKKYYPEEFQKLTVIISKSNKTNRNFFVKLGVKRILYYEHISKLYSAKVNWEGAR